MHILLFFSFSRPNTNRGPIFAQPRRNLQVESAATPPTALTSTLDTFQVSGPKPTRPPALSREEGGGTHLNLRYTTLRCLRRPVPVVLRLLALALQLSVGEGGGHVRTRGVEEGGGKRENSQQPRDVLKQR